MDDSVLKTKARWVRRQVLEMITGAGHGHIGGSFSAVEILVALYQGGLLSCNPRRPDWESRDRFVMSKGHSSEALYAVLADAGFFDVAVLDTYGAPGSILGGHVDHHLPGIEISTGSLGHGLGIAAGLALAARMDGEDFLSVALLGDGECYEGSVWESVMFAAQHRLDKLVAIVDRNRQITLEYTETVNRLEPFAAKWESFGWDVLELDGHSFEAISKGWQEIRARESGRPIALIANTVKGKGISFMAQSLDWHHNVPKGEQLEVARRELAADA